MSATIQFRFSVFPICHLTMLRITYTKVSQSAASGFLWMFELTYVRNCSSTPCPVSGPVSRSMAGRAYDCFVLTVQRFVGGPKMVLLFVYALGKRGLRQSGVGDCRKGSYVVK